MEAKNGDRVSIDAKKVGQPKRTGVITKVNRGLSGIRYQVKWDDGHESVLSPGAGNLCVEANGGNAKRAAGNSKRPKAKARPKARAKPKAKARPARKKTARGRRR